MNYQSAKVSYICTMEKKQQLANLNLHEQRFRLLMKLIRVDTMLKSAKITHKPAFDGRIG